MLHHNNSKILFEAKHVPERRLFFLVGKGRSVGAWTHVGHLLCCLSDGFTYADVISRIPKLDLLLMEVPILKAGADVISLFLSMSLKLLIKLYQSSRSARYLII